MNDIIFYLVAGLGIGSLYAMLGAGLVVVYKGSGVINFAQGAMAMYGVATFDRAWNQGEIFLPWVDFLPTDTAQPARCRSRSATAARCRWAWPSSSPWRWRRCIGLGRPLPRVPAAAPRRAARQGGRLARPRPVPAGRRPAQLRHELPDAEVGLPERELGVRELPRPRQPVPPQQPVRLLRRRHRRRRRLGASTSSPASAWRRAPRRATRRAPCCSATRRSGSPPRTGSSPRCSPRSPPSSSARSRARSPRSG